MAIIAKYKFNSSLYSDYLPTFNKEFTGYIKTDVTNSDGTIIRTISHDTLKPTFMRFGVSGSSATDREKSLLEVIECDTSQVTSMVAMFQNCSSLTSLDLSSFNTSQVTFMNGMFESCSSLTLLNISNFNTSKVTDMTSMFKNCKLLTSLDLSNFNTDSVTRMDGMFYGCNNLTSLDLSNFNTSSVTTMYFMFNGCSSLTSLDLSNFNTSQVTDMRYMFNGCSSLTSLDLSNFNTSNVTAMSYMFSGCSVPNIGLLYATSSTINSLLAQLGTGVARNIYYTDAPLNELTVQNNITYKKYELTMATFPYTLNKLPNGVADYIDVVNKVHVQRVGKFVADGSSDEVWDIKTFPNSTVNTECTIFTIIHKDKLDNWVGNKICDKWNLIDIEITTNDIANIEGIYKGGNADSFFINVSNTKATTVEQWKIYLQSNPFIYLYELKTPIYTPLTDEEIAQLPLSAYKDGYVNLSSDQLTPSFKFRMRASNRYQVDMLETGYYYLNAPTGNIKLGTASVDVQQMPCIVKVDNVGTGDSGYRLGFSGEVLDTTQITLAKLPSHRIPTSFTQGMKCGTDFGYWEGIKVARPTIFRTANPSSGWSIVETSSIEGGMGVVLNRIESGNTIIEDEFDVATGKFTKRIGEVVLDGSHNCSRESLTVSNQSLQRYIIQVDAPHRNGCLGLTNCLPFLPSQDKYGVDYVRPCTTNGFWLYQKEDLSTEEVKKRLARNPITVYYELEVPEISYLNTSLSQVKTVANTVLQCTRNNGYLNAQVKPSHLTYPVPSLVGNRTYTVVHNRKNIGGSTKPIELNLGGTVVQLNDASSKTLVKTPSTLAHSSLIFIGGESTVDHIMVLDGDWTNKPIEYFENMKGHDTDAIITIIGDGKIDDVAEQYLW